MSAAGEVRVHGLRELQRDLGKYAKDVRKEVRDELKQAAETVRASAEQKAPANISRLGPTWSRMRIGITSRAVYVAPKSRRRNGTPRPNLAPLLMNEAMLPALEEHRSDVERALEQMLDRLGSRNGF